LATVIGLPAPAFANQMRDCIDSLLDEGFLPRNFVALIGIADFSAVDFCVQRPVFATSRRGSKGIAVWNILGSLPTALHKGLPGLDSKVSAVAFQRSSRSSDPSCLASGHEDGTVAFWDLRSGKSDPQGKHSLRVTSLASANGIVISGSDDGKAILWS